MVGGNCGMKAISKFSHAMCNLLLLYLLVITECFALYEDQVGLFDWKQQYIGNAKEMYFEQTAHSGSTRVFLSTESNVLASLNARTGHLMWRKLFENINGKIHKLFHSNELLITISGKIVRAWDQHKGHLVWETTVSSHLSSEDAIESERILKSHQALLLDEENGGLIVFADNVVKLISQTDGSDIWFHELPNDFNGNFIGVAKCANKIVGICIQKKGTQVLLNFRYLDLESGDLLSDIIIPAPWILQRDVTCDILSSKYMACINKNSFVMLVKDFSHGSREAFIGVDLGQLNISQSETLDESFIKSLSVSSDDVLFYFKVNPGHHILGRINSSNQHVVLVKEMFNIGLFTIGKLGSKQFVFEIYKENITSQNLQVHVSAIDDLQNEISALHSVVAYDDQHFQGIPIQCTVFMHSKKNDVSYRLLIATDEHALSLVQNIGNKECKILWTRNEALARITSAKMIELPPSTSTSKLELLHAEFSNVANNGILTMFLNRIKSQIRQLQAFVESFRKKQHYDSSLEDDDSSALRRDQFNIIKIILTVTEGRKLFAINSQNGNVVWSRILPDIQRHVGESNLELIEQRTTAHFLYPPKCIIIAPYHNKTNQNRGQSTPEENTVVYSFNPLTGEGLNKPERIESFRVLKVSELPFEDEYSAKVIGIVDTEHQFHIYPETEDTLSKLRKHINSIYIYLVNKNANTFKGYKIRFIDGKYKLYEVYSVFIPRDQTIVKVMSKRHDEVVNSVGRVLGDHTVLYKYLNPNVVAILTAQSSGNKDSVFIYVVDAVIGHVLYQARHNGAEQPADLILSEHWLVYMYYNSKGRRMEVSVLEFYEGYEEKNHTAFSSLDPVGQPMILSQGYFLSTTNIKTVTVTNTRHGITNKNILIGLDNGYVYSLPKLLLDPRRSFQQTQILQEEGVPPYMPEIPLVAQGYMNYNQTVPLIRGMHTSAAGLESTSLVLVYGLDVYFTRITPSKMFDVLKEDFDYVFISAVLSGLILASIVFGKFSSMKVLKMAWT